MVGITIIILTVAAFLIPVIIGVKYLNKNFDAQRAERERSIGEINIVVDDSLRINPRMKESLKQFSIKGAHELRGMNPQELINLLSCSANALRVFEGRIEQISYGYERYENLIGEEFSLPLALSSKKEQTKVLEMREERFAPLKEKLDEQAKKAVATFAMDLRAEGSILNVIPKEYRYSYILDMMCGYLSSGEVDNWADCIKTFKTDSHRMQEMDAWQGFQDSIDRIEKRMGRIEFYSAITMINTW
jgi:hypothetical protein